MPIFTLDLFLNAESAPDDLVDPNQIDQESENEHAGPQRRRSVNEHACIWSEKGRMKRAVKQRNMPRCAAKNHASTGSDNTQEKLA
jgi:hypothetical protein